MDPPFVGDNIGNIGNMRESLRGTLSNSNSYGNKHAAERDQGRERVDPPFVEDNIGNMRDPF